MLNSFYLLVGNFKQRFFGWKSRRTTNFKSYFFVSFSVFLFSSLGLANLITLDDAFKSAMVKTESILLAKSQLRAAEARRDEINGNLLPSLTAGVNYQLQEKNINSVGEKDQATAKLTLSQSLYAGGRDKANLTAVSFDRETQNYNVANSKVALYVVVSRNFYSVLSTAKEVENIKKSIELTQKRIAELRVRKQIGKSRTIEVLAAEAQLAILDAQLLAAQGQSVNAKNIFSGFTGIPNEVPLDDTINLPKEVPSLQNFLSTIGQRPDLLALQSSVKSNEYSKSVAEAAQMPSLDFMGNYYAYRYRAIQSSPDWDAMLVFTMPIFTGGISKARVREAIEKHTQAELQLQQKQKDAELEIHTGYNSLVSSLAQAKALEKALLATEQNYREQEKDYRFSLATNLDVLQALNTFQETKRSLDRTRYEVLSLMAALKAAANQVELVREP
jgi:outer membrane protein